MSSVNLIESSRKLPNIKGFLLNSIISSLFYIKEIPGEQPLNIVVGTYYGGNTEIRILIQSPANVILNKENNFSELKTQRLDDKLLYIGYNPKIDFFDYKETFTWIDNENLFTVSLKTEENKEKLVQEIIKTKEKIDPIVEKLIKPLPEIKGYSLIFNSSSMVSPTTTLRFGAYSYGKTGKEVLAYLYEGDDSKRIYQELIGKMKSRKEFEEKIEGLIDDKVHIIFFDELRNTLAYTSGSEESRESCMKICMKIIEKLK
ncbi:MAG: hypothetical protein QW474_00205 [Candidatus Aenigmatarchaeota archaeon]